jgi:dimethylglycine dehydrogenase
MLATDPRRFGPYCTKRYVVKKNEETYRKSSRSTFRTRSARPRARQDQPVYDKLDRWARSGASATAGSAPTGSRRPASSAAMRWSFRRSNYFEHVGNEVPS